MVFSPGMFGLTPEQIAAGKEVGEHLRMQITKYPQEGRLEVRYTLINPEDAKIFDMCTAVDKLAEQLAYGHATMFGMKGEIINVD